MKPVDQTRFGTEGEQTGDCFAAAIASIFEVPLEEVPHDASWPRQWSMLVEWLSERGFALLDIRTGSRHLGYHVKCGESERGLEHAVVGFGSEVVHDPHPSRSGLKSESRAFAFVPFDPIKGKA